MALVAESVQFCASSGSTRLTAAPRTPSNILCQVDRQLPRAKQLCRSAGGCTRGPAAAKASDGNLTAHSTHVQPWIQEKGRSDAVRASPSLPAQQFPVPSRPSSSAAGNVDLRQQLQRKPQHHASDQLEETEPCSQQPSTPQNTCTQRPLQQHVDMLPLPQAATWAPSRQQQQQHHTMMPHPFCTLDHRLLTHRIKRCLGWHDAAVLFAQQSQCMNHINFAALITHLAQLRSNVASRPVNWMSFVAQIMTASAQHLNLCSPRQLSNMAWGLATLGYSDWVNLDGTWAAQWQQQLQQQLHTASCRDISNTLWAAATTISSIAKDNSSSSSSSGSSGWPYGSRRQPLVVQQQQHVLSNPRLQQELLSALHRELPNSTPQDVSNSLWALAALNLNPTPELQQYLLIRVQAHSSHLKPQEVAQTLWALAQLRAQPPAEWLRELLLKQVSATAGDKTGPPGQGSHVICLGASNMAQDLAPGGQVPEVDGSSASPRKQLVGISGQRATAGSSVVDNHSCQQQQQPSRSLDIIGSRAQVAVRRSRSAQPGAGGYPQQQQQQKTGVLGESNVQNLVICLVACAQLKQAPPEKWLNQTLVQLEVLLLQDSTSSSSSSTSNISSRPAQDLANVIWALGSLGIKPHTAWTDNYLRASSRVLHVARPQELCNVIWGLARLGISPTPGWLQCFDAASGACMWGFTAQGLGDVLAAQHRLRLQPSGAWREGWMQGLQACWGSADAAAVCKTLWAAAKFDLPLARHWLHQALLQAHGELQRALLNQEITYEELLRLVWAVGRLRRGALHQSVSDMLGLHCSRAAAKMSWQQLKSVAQGLRRLKPLPRHQLLCYFCELTESRMRYMPAEQAEDLRRYVQLLKDAAQRQQLLQQQQAQQQTQQALHWQQEQRLSLQQKLQHQQQQQQQHQQQQARTLVGVSSRAAS